MIVRITEQYLAQKGLLPIRDHLASVASETDRLAGFVTRLREYEYDPADSAYNFLVEPAGPTQLPEPGISCEAVEKHLQSCELHPLEKEDSIKQFSSFRGDCVQCGNHFVVSVDIGSSAALQRRAKEKFLEMLERCTHQKHTPHA